MESNIWKLSKKKYGIAICNYKGSGDPTLSLYVGEAVHIFEEYGSGSTAWYRGFSMANKDKMGVFPACLVHIKPCDVHNEGLYEIVTPQDGAMVKEVFDVLHEWNVIWKDLYVKGNGLFEKIQSNMEELIILRGKLVAKKLSQEEAHDLKNDIVSIIDWGNGHLDLDLVPRIEGEQVDCESCSLIQLYRVHINSSKIALEDQPQRRRRKTTKLSKGEMVLDAGLTMHHLLVSFRSFGFHVGDNTETLLSLHQYKDNKLVCITEKFLVRHTRHMVPENLEKIENYYGLFTDLSTEEIEKDLYLVAHIYRIGSMKSEPQKKSPKITYKRPCGVGVHHLADELTSLNLANLPATFKEWEYQMKITVFSKDNEEQFAGKHEELIKKMATGTGNPLSTSHKQLPTLTMSLQILHGDLANVKKEDPMLFSKGVAQIQKLGFIEDLSPGEIRNDLYVTMKTADLDRGSKKSQKNVEVKVTVVNEAGQLIKDCITYGCGEAGKSEYYTSVYYHSNKPEWNETLRISVPIDIFPGSHLCFEIFHCSVSNLNKEVRCPYGFAFVRVTNEAQIVINDNVHKLCVYKLDEKHRVDKQQFFKSPFLLDDLGDPRHIPDSPTKLLFKPNDSLTITTLLCSGKFTQTGDLLGILNWKGEQFKDKLGESLEKLRKMQGDEVVKFLHDIMDALFDMLMEDSARNEYSNKIFQSMINIFTLIHHVRFETFKPVLENYITDTFSATLVHKPLCACFANMIDMACKHQHKMNTPNVQLIQSFQVMDYIFRFIVQSSLLQRKDVFSRGSSDASEFWDNVHKVFKCMGVLLSSTADNLKAYQIALLNQLHSVYVPLMEVLPDKEIATLVKLILEHMSHVTQIPEDITRVKIELLQKTVATKLFTSDVSRHLLLPLCLEEVKQCYEARILMRMATELFSDVIDSIFNLKQTISIKEDIQNIIQSIFDVVMATIIYLRDTVSTKGSLIACLIEMLRLMEEEHYDSLLHVYHRGHELKTFLFNIIEVFQVVVQPAVFPQDWTVMRMVTNNVVFTSMEYFSDALKKNFMVMDKFDHQVWSSYFQLAVSFITQPSLQLDKYSELNAHKIRDRYQDMRVLMGVQVETHWNSLDAHKRYFIPDMVGPFLELTLVSEEDVRKVTLPIIFDMMEWDQRLHGNFKQVEASLIEKLDYFLTQQLMGDTCYKDLFKQILLERVQSEPSLQENGTQFVISVTHLLERLLDYRQVVDGDENRDKRMHCTFNILNFYKDEINREEMYIRYVNKLHDLHMVANNHAEAGLTLQLYARVLTWSEHMLPEEMKYKPELEKDRKEMLYTQIINCFDKGKVWEYALPLCKDLAEYYERNLDYKQLGDILKQQASFYQKILEGLPGEDPSQPATFYPRQDPSYYRVSYYGQSFPAFVRNKQFIYRGDECLKLATIINHMTAEFPTAQIIPNNTMQKEGIKDGEQQYIQICSVKPIAGDRVEFHGRDVPLEIRNFYNNNEVDTFQFDRPYQRGEKDRNNECKTLCLERTKIKTAYKFPGILRWYEVVDVQVEMLCPIRVAIETLKQNNTEIQTIVTRCKMNPKVFFPQLEMKLQGNITASVGGGIKNYHEAFFSKEFETQHPDEAIFLDEMKRLLHEQIELLHHGMQMHDKLVPNDLRPLHESLESGYKKMKKAVIDHSSQYNSMNSLRSVSSDLGRPSTSGSTSSSARSSTHSQDDESIGVTHPDMPANKLSQTGSEPKLTGTAETSSPRSGNRISRARNNTISSVAPPPPMPQKRRPSESAGVSVPTLPTYPPELPKKSERRNTVIGHQIELPMQPSLSNSHMHKPVPPTPPLPPRRGSDAGISPENQRMSSENLAMSAGSASVADTPSRPNKLSVNGYVAAINASHNSSTAPPPIPKRAEKKMPSPAATNSENHTTNF